MPQIELTTLEKKIEQTINEIESISTCEDGREEKRNKILSKKILDTNLNL